MQESDATPSSSVPETSVRQAFRPGVMLFLVVSGCFVAILPFSTYSQSLVLLHTLIGLLACVAIVGSRISRSNKFATRGKHVFEYIAPLLIAVVVVSGVVVTLQALFGRYVSRVWDVAHLWIGIALAIWFVFALSRSKIRGAGLAFATKRAWLSVVAVAAALFLISAGIAVIGTQEVRSGRSRDSFAGWTFLPSMVNTESGKPLQLARIANSQSCGTSDCHAAIYDEWLGSAHRWSGEDEFFQEVRTVTTQVKGVGETEKCAACHDPVSLLSGHKDPKLGRASPGVTDGDSCVVCHAVRKVDERGIGSYVLGEPRAYLFEGAAGRIGVTLNHFLIRCYPDQHNRDFDLTIVRKPESCAPCHKEYDVLDEREGPVQVETQFDDWKHGKWNTDADVSKRLYCQQCHMGLLATSRSGADPYDLKKSWGKQHRNHAFAAANQYMPTAIASHNEKTQVDKAHEWLRGERHVSEIENTWPKGPIVELKLTPPTVLRRTGQARVIVTLTNKKVGHSFPTGPLNIARAWIELVVKDESGRTVFHSGLLDDKHHIEDGSYVLKPLAINMSGQMIMKKDLWHPVGPQFRRAILAGQSDTYDYTFTLPSDARGPLVATARLRYSKANQFFMEAVHPSERRTAPITDISSATATIALEH